MSSNCICIAVPYAPTLADEDNEQDPDRWCSHSARGQECWQLVSQWVWNLRLELGHQLEPTPLRITEFAPAFPPQSEQVATHPASVAPASGYGPPTTATRLGKRGALPELTFLSSLMARSVARRATSWSLISDGENAMGVCGSSILPAFATAVRARCAGSVNGKALRPKSRAR